MKSIKNLVKMDCCIHNKLQLLRTKRASLYLALVGDGEEEDSLSEE
jgi:hypothetical protein